MEAKKRLTNSGDDPEVAFHLPIPQEPLREHLPISIDVVVAQMEALLEAASLGPEFEAIRLANKNPEPFRM